MKVVVTKSGARSSKNKRPVKNSWITKHKVVEGDARDLSFIATESVHLVCTSPPYGSLIQYPDHQGQLGNFASYDRFLEEMDKVWAEATRPLFL
jgi:modification methylase